MLYFRFFISMCARHKSLSKLRLKIFHYFGCFVVSLGYHSVASKEQKKHLFYFILGLSPGYWKKCYFFPFNPGNDFSYYVSHRESKTTDLHFFFVSCQLTMPSPMPEYLNVHYICETASRLLFLSMHWARSIPSFQALG